MTFLFEVAAGSVTGRDHAGSGRNNQDAVCWSSTPAATVAVVSDGCGSGRHSELGARLGARLVAAALHRHAAGVRDAAGAGRALESVRRDVLATLADVARHMGGPLASVVGDHLLFTVLGAAVTADTAFVFAMGDGVAAVNGAVEVLSCPGNAPPYLAYGLAGLLPQDEDAPRFQLLRLLPAAGLEALLLGSDGAAALLQAAEGSLPGRSEAVGALRQFWEDDRHFRNPASLGRRLAMINRESQRIDWSARRLTRERGLLADDTTLAVIRRRRQGLPARESA